MALWKRLLLTGLVLGGIFFSQEQTKELIIPKQNKSLEEVLSDAKQTQLRNLDSRYKFSKEELSKFNYWIDSTLTESAQNNTNSIIIDKSAYALYLIKNGEIDSKYNIELGKPYSDKEKQGDGCTPEGMYRITWKRDKGQTSFYRAFLLNYPNKEDRAKGKTGGLVEIHGWGSGKPGNKGGHNWTKGCPAILNKDMDTLFIYEEEKDRVTIVRYTDKILDPNCIKLLNQKAHSQ